MSVRVAHITDSHLLESDHARRSGRHRFRMNFLKELGCALLIGLHHQVFPHSVSVGTWWDGLRDYTTMLSLLRDNPEVFAFHGHIHKEVTRPVRPNAHPQVFCARATVDSDVLYRHYEVDSRIIVPIESRPGAVCVEGPGLPVAAE
ncbi:MAG: hypothetical protein WBG86_08890 [Polyangiales bacterium]